MVGLPLSLIWPQASAHFAQKEGKDIKQCAKEVDECEGLRSAYTACKRGQLDPRARLWGNKGY